jgi:hypothetical protein
MNANLLNIAKCITAKHGESILGDFVRINGYLKHYTKGEPKEECTAFGHYIKQGFYRELKYAKRGDERHIVSASLDVAVKMWDAENGQLIRALLSAE